MQKRKLYIGESFINEAAKNPDFLAALAFCIMVKREHVNSMLLDFNWKEIMSLCHCNYATAKKIRYDAEEFGLIRYDGKNEIYEHIVCKSLRPKERKNCIVFTIHKDENGSYIYLESNYRKKEKFNCQTLSDTKNLILKARFLCGLKSRDKAVTSCEIRAAEAMRLKQFNDISSGKDVSTENYDIRDYKDPAQDPIKRGYSYDKILKNMYGNSIGKYKLVQLIKQMIKDGLLMRWYNKYKFRSYQCGQEQKAEHFTCTINHQTGEKVNLLQRGGLIFKKYEGGCVYYRHMANGYMPLANVSRRIGKNCNRVKHKRNKSNKIIGDKITHSITSIGKKGVKGGDMSMTNIQEFCLESLPFWN